MTRRKVVSTANFWRNVEGLRDFHTTHPAAFERAIGKLQDEVLPLLRQQCNVGRLYTRRQLERPIIERIAARLGGGVLREFVLDGYVLLYLVGKAQIAMLSIRHQRELDFDFGD